MTLRRPVSRLGLLFLNIFWDQRYRRLRAFWRLAVFVCARSVSVAVLTELAGRLGWLQRQPVLVTVTIRALATLVPACICAICLDRRTGRDLGLPLSRANWADLGLGLALGATLMTIIFCVSVAFGWVRVTGYAVGYAGPMSVAIPLIVWLLVGIHEEVWARGYLLINLAEGLRGATGSDRWALLLAWAITSLYFGALHADNPGATVTSTLFLVGAGFFLGLGIVLSGRLGQPIGLHIAWNLFQGTVFGFAVSGWRLSPFSVIRTSSRGPVLWTGGTFGPEAGLLGALAMVAGSGAILLIARVRCGRIALATELATPPVSRMADAHG